MLNRLLAVISSRSKMAIEPSIFDFQFLLDPTFVTSLKLIRTRRTRNKRENTLLQTGEDQF